MSFHFFFQTFFANEVFLTVFAMDPMRLGIN